MTFEIILPEKISNDELTSTDIKYFDKLINSIYVTDKYVHYLGRPKKLNKNDPFYTIMNEQTWNKSKKLKYEEYIKQKFGNPDKFNEWCLGNKLQLYVNDKKNAIFC